MRMDGDTIPIEPLAGSGEPYLNAAEAVLASDPQRSISMARQSLHLARKPQGLAHALLLIGRAEYRLGHLKEALESLLQAKELFSEVGDGAGRLDALLELARAERDLGRPEDAAKRCDAALTLSRSLHDAEAETDALNLQASAYNAIGEYGRALESLDDALEIAREHGFEERQGNILSNIGTLHTLLGDYPRALESLTAAYEVVREAAPGTRSEGTNLISLGHLYREIGDIQEARKYFMEARGVGREAEDRVVEAAAINSLANTYIASADWGTARELFERALELARQIGMRQYEIDNLDGLGQVHAALSEYERAVDVHLQALEVAREISDRNGELDALLNLGRDYLAMDGTAQAIEALREGLTLAEKTGRKVSVYEAHELLAAAYERTGRLAQALDHHRAFHRVEKSVFNEASEQNTRQLAMRLQLERARHETQQYRLRMEITQQARQEAEATVRERTRDLQEAQLEIVTRLAVAAEYRDDHTGEHTRRVGRNAAAIATVMGCSEHDVDLIFTAARLHDVGKIGIRDAVLLKPGTLTPDEFELMRAHTTIGARILSGGRSKLLRFAEEIALAHHERWDGNGYPLGLAGDDIPLAARIVAVADVLDALTHARPYKKAWPVEQALAEIERQSGHQFDPRVVAACLQVFDEDTGISPLEPAGDRPLEGLPNAHGEPPRRRRVARDMEASGSNEPARYALTAATAVQ